MVSTDKFNLLHSYIFRKNNVIMDNTFSYKDRSILYICQNGTSGYANAAKGYIYDYISKRLPIKIQYFNFNESIVENDRFNQYINSQTQSNIDYNTIIVHSTPDIWDSIVKNAPNVNFKQKTIIGRTVWEFEKLIPSWVQSINSSIVDIVSVPTEWNKQCFINNGVKKPIIVEPHIFVDYPYKKTGFKHILSKSVIISRTQRTFDIGTYYKFYCIGQLINRKGILETVESFCNTFTSLDKVILIVKTFKLNYSKEEQQKCIDDITNITQLYDHAPIVFIKEMLNYDEVRSLHDIGDCYFQLTKTEGFGLGIFDAYNVGKNIITTGYGGQIEYLGDQYDGLVKYDLKKLFDDENVFFTLKLDSSYKWAEPDLNHSKQLLRKSVYGKTPKFLTEINKSIFEQNNTAKIIDLPYSNTDFYFNSSIFNGIDGKTLLMTRYSKLVENYNFLNTIKIFELNDNFSFKKEINLSIKNEIPNEQYEDPRVLVHDDKYYVSCANYDRLDYRFIHQKLLIFDKNFNHIGNIHPKYDGNEKNAKDNMSNQKNWTWFVYENKLMCVYKMYPHTVLEFDWDGNVTTEYKTYFDVNSIWKYGECRMGSNPILKDGYYHNYFHSSLPWKYPKRQYYMGYYKFESVPPFRIVEISEDPILYGNESDERILKNISPIVIFPCGIIQRDNKFIVSFGLNDEKTGIVKL